MTEELSIPLAVEKVLFRLALLEGGRVAIARAFLELPLAIEVLEHEADKAADGMAIVKDDWAEFLAYDFPELRSGNFPAPPQDCPTCGRLLPDSAKPKAVEGQPPPIRGPIMCEPCYRVIRRASQHHDETAFTRVKHFFKGEEEQDLFKVALVEHEIFFVALRLGGRDLTHTAIAAQTRLPSAQVKERLDRLAGRRYICQGLLPSGDVFAYKFPIDLTYPEALYRRVQGAVIATHDEPPRATPVMTAKARVTSFLGPLIRAKPSDVRPVGDIMGSQAAPSAPPPPPPPPPPPAPKFNIKVKDKRDRGTPRPPQP